MLARLRRAFERVLEWIVIALLLLLALEVVLGVVYRYLGNPIAWYDEIASVLLAWVTYYGAALAALKRAHIGVPGFISALSARPRLAAVLLGEACILAFFALLAWYGVRVLQMLSGDTLATVDLPVLVTQSVIPIGALLFIAAELLNLPETLRDCRRHRRSAAAAADGVDL
jgi:TRAP-type C4-dicarboxylate transport system permease small subunit